MGAVLASGLWSAGCGEPPAEVIQVGRSVSDAAEGSVDVGKAAVDVAGDTWQAIPNYVDAKINRRPLELRRFMCEQERGTWVDAIDVGPCVGGRAELTIGARQQSQACEGERQGASFADQCLHISSDGAWYFNDGPSVPHMLVAIDTEILQWSEIFWDAAVNHDYCYHHGAATYGYGRDICDAQILDDLLAICEAGFPSGEEGLEASSSFNREACGKQAHRAYMALVYGGEDNFAAMNTRVNYPAYRPMWRQRGLPGKVADEKMRQTIRERPLDAVAQL